MGLTESVMLVSYGYITSSFKTIAKLKKQLDKIKNGEVNSHKLDCYKINEIPDLEAKFVNELKIPAPKSIEIFYPSDKYPPHTDDGGISYFVALENGNFYINNVSYPIVPFVLYAFEDSNLHNTDFCAIMLK